MNGMSLGGTLRIVADHETCSDLERAFGHPAGSGR
jgi:hypothetical protein